MYRRKTNYHETDQMGVIHHSNYIKYLEEARIHFFDFLGINYNKLEEAGIYSPVLRIEIDYKKLLKFDDEINIEVNIVEYSPAKFILSYNIYNVGSDKLVSSAKTSHCFVSEEGKLISLKKHDLNMHEILTKHISEVK